MTKKDFIKEIGKTLETVNFEKKKNFRSFLVNDNSCLNNDIKAAAESVRMPAYKKAILKEKLILASDLRKKEFVFGDIFKKVLSGGLAFAVLFAMVNTPYEFTDVAKASSPISVSAVSGNVKVLRLGQEINVYPSFQLSASDKVITQDGFVEIVFEDKSLLRVNENSNIVIDNINNFAGRTDSTISIKSGSFWFNAVGGANRTSEYNFRSPELLVEVDDDSVLSMEVNDLYGQVVVFSESAEVNYRSKESFQSSVLRKGDLIKVKKEQDEISVVDSVLLAEDISVNQRTWYLDNLKKDQLYKQSLADESLLKSRGRITVTPDSLWYPLKEAQRATKVALTLDPVKKAEVKLQIADEKLHEAKILTDEGKSDLAKKNLDQYKETLDNVIRIATEVEKDQGAEVSLKLKNDAKNLVESHKQDIAVNTNSDKNLKEVILDSELKIAEVSGEATKVKLKQIDAKLDELQSKKLIEKIDTQTSLDAASSISVITNFQVSEEDNDEAEVLLKDFSNTVKELKDVDEDVSKILNEQVVEIEELKNQTVIKDENLSKELEADLKNLETQLNITKVTSELVVSEDITDSTVIKAKIELDSLVEVKDPVVMPVEVEPVVEPNILPE